MVGNSDNNLESPCIIQHGQLCTSYPCFSEIETFRKDTGHHAHHIWHQHFFCGGAYIKDSAYRDRPLNLHGLKASISNITADISPTALQAVATNMIRRARLCMQHAVHRNFVIRTIVKHLTLSTVLVHLVHRPVYCRIPV
jgi:hypothetical protein